MPSYGYKTRFVCAVAHIMCSTQAWLNVSSPKNSVVVKEDEIPAFELENFALLSAAIYYSFVFTGEMFAPSRFTIHMRNVIFQTLIFPTTMAVIAGSMTEYPGINPYPAQPPKAFLHQNRMVLMLITTFMETVSVYHGQRDLIGDVFRIAFWASSFGAVLYFKYPDVAAHPDAAVAVAVQFWYTCLVFFLFNKAIESSIWEVSYDWFSPPTQEASFTLQHGKNEADEVEGDKKDESSASSANTPADAEGSSSMKQIIAQGVERGYGDAADANHDGTTTRSETAAFRKGNEAEAKEDDDFASATQLMSDEENNNDDELSEEVTQADIPKSLRFQSPGPKSFLANVPTSRLRSRTTRSSSRDIK